MCISMYKQTNAFLPLSMISENSSGSEKFNNYCEKLKKRKLCSVTIVQDAHVRKRIIQRRVNA